MEQEAKAYNKAADDMYNEALCVISNPTEINLKSLRDTAEAYRIARNALQVIRLAGAVGTAKPGPTDANLTRN